MAKNKTKKNTLNKKGVTKATARPTHVVGESKNSPIGEVRRLLATAAFIREMWMARQIAQPVFDGDPTPLPSEEILGRRPTESEYAAATAILLAQELPIRPETRKRRRFLGGVRFRLQLRQYS